MSFLIHGLDKANFEHLFAMSEAQLRERHIVRQTVAAPHATPCRVSLQDAAPGEQVLLLPYAHLTLDTPYRSSGPIFVRPEAERPQLQVDEVPDCLRRRLLAVRAYDASGWMLGHEVVPGAELAPTLEALLALPGAAFANLHYARAGCYAARAERVG